MKLIKIFAFTLITVFSAMYLCWAQYYAAKFMDVSVAEKKWGLEKFEPRLFRSKNPSSRSSMAVDILKRKIYLGKDMSLVRKELGNPDSYFFSDTIYAYKIMPFPGANEENWHLVFIPDESLEKVKEVKIHKKCCYKSPL